MNNPRNSDSASPPQPAGWGGFALLLAVCLPLLLWRMTFESSIWCDESLSIQMSQYDWRHIIDITSNAAHPAGYYLLLKFWIWLGRQGGLVPGVFWGRFLNVIPWLALALVAWRVGRRLLGPSHGALLAWCLMLGAQEAYVAKDLRGYALAVPALGIAFLFLFLIDARRRDDSAGGRGAGWLWTGYGLALALALWMHILSSVMAALLGLLWLALAARGPHRHGFLIGGALAHGAALLCFSPWLVLINHNVHYWSVTPHQYMTPPTLANLARVFTLWYPLGQLSGGAATLARPDRLLPLGLLSAIVPLAALGWSRLRASRERRSPATPLPRAMMAAALGLAGGYVLLLWALDRWQVIQVFYGPRYTVPGVSLWAMGLVLLACRAADRAGWPPWAAWVLTIPWMLSGLTGQTIDATLERAAGLPAALRTIADRLPPAGSPLYITPSELIPYYRNSFRDYQLRPVEALAGSDVEAPREGADVALLSVSAWGLVRRERDNVLLTNIKYGHLAEQSDRITFPWNHANDFQFIQLKGFRAGEMNKIAATGWKAPSPAAPPDAIVQILPRDVWMNDGWQRLEIDRESNSSCWTAANPAGIRLSVPLGPGRYLLGLNGVRPPYAPPDTPLTLTVDGETSSSTILPPQGWMDLRIPFVLTHTHERPIVRLHYPVYRIMDQVAGSQDPRFVGLFVHQLWIAPARDRQVAGDR